MLTCQMHADCSVKQVHMNSKKGHFVPLQSLPAACPGLMLQCCSCEWVTLSKWFGGRGWTDKLVFAWKCFLVWYATWALLMIQTVEWSGGGKEWGGSLSAAEWISWIKVVMQAPPSLVLNVWEARESGPGKACNSVSLCMAWYECIFWAGSDLCKEKKLKMKL